jgi:hypothetical protein
VPAIPRDLLTSEADVVLIQRIAIRDIELAEKIARRCRSRGAKLIFEIDDDLFNLPQIIRNMRTTPKSREQLTGLPKLPMP